MTLPKISIITPSYNQGSYLEQTIRSVLDQQYPNLEYIIIDGDSTDDSVDIIKKYENLLTYWETKPDNGQCHAINKGFNKCTGEIVTWLNSDDIYLPNTLIKVGQYFLQHPNIDLLYGNQIDIDESGKVFRALKSYQLNKSALLSRGGAIPQPASFFRKKILDKIGNLNEDLHWAMDYDLFLRIAFNNYKIQHVPIAFVKFRYHQNSKTVSGKTDTNHHEEYMKMVQTDYLNKFANDMPLYRLYAIKVINKLKFKMINIPNYFKYFKYYLNRVKSYLSGHRTHKY